MITQRLSAWQLKFAVTGDPTSALVDQHGKPFNGKLYSWFKYGYDPAARFYAEELYKMLFSAKNGDWWRDGRPIVIVSAPYVHLATASDGIAHYLWQLMTHKLVAEGYEPPRHIAFDKDTCGSPVYATALTGTDRDARNDKHVYHADEALVNGAHVIVVDDVRVTGAAERAYLRYFGSLKLHSLWSVYAAIIDQSVLDCPNGPQAGIENILNQTTPVSLARIIQHIARDEWRLNSRVLRFILEQPANELRQFALAIPTPRLEQMLDAVPGRGVSYFGKYRTSYDVLRDVVSTRRTGGCLV